MSKQAKYGAPPRAVTRHHFACTELRSDSGAWRDCAVRHQDLQASALPPALRIQLPRSVTGQGLDSLLNADQVTLDILEVEPAGHDHIADDLELSDAANLERLTSAWARYGFFGGGRCVEADRGGESMGDVVRREGGAAPPR
jgi:hypothetical protein